MKPVDPTFWAWLEANWRNCSYADCITFELLGGTDEARYRWRITNVQRDITADPLDGTVGKKTWRAKQAVISGLRSKAGIGYNVDGQDVKLSTGSDVMVQGLPLKQAILQGVFDGARVRRDRYYMPIGSFVPMGGIPKFYGYVTTFDSVGRTDATLKVKSGLVRLNMPMPRHTAQGPCANTYGDAACGVDLATVAVTSVVSASPASTTTFVAWSSASTIYARGKIFFENMGLVGTWRSIKKADSTGLWLNNPLPRVPTVGEQFVAYRGCDRLRATCDVINPNAATRFRGCRFTPTAETAM